MSAASTPAGSGAEQGAARTKSENEERSEEAKKQQVILVAYLIATLDLIFLFMQLGVMPYLAKSLGLDSVGFGYLQTTFGVLQLVGGPIFGRILLMCICSHCNPRESYWLPPKVTESGSGPLYAVCVDVYFLLTLPLGLFLIMFSIISMDFFGLEAVQSGYLMSYFGVLQMVVQGLVIGRLTSLCTERTLLRLSVFVFAGVGLGMALMRNVLHYCIVAVPLVFAFSTLGTITDSILTKSVPASDTGTMLGICASVQPLTRTVGPAVGGLLYKQFGVSSFGYLQLVVNVGLFVYLLKSNIPLKEGKGL
uniref:Solute carrier family 22 member 18 n=1 Tax=Apteryx owenii TaxID=8824 RepID=A0A8B9NTT0_APTOW